jgi:NAD+ diphosphatase
VEYPEATTLPFNKSLLGDAFVAACPGHADPGGPGWWIIFREDTLVMESIDNKSSRRLLEGRLPPWAEGHEEAVFMGLWKGAPVRILEIGHETEIPSACVQEPLLLAFLNESLPDDLMSIAGRAQQILSWKKKSAACPRCGGETGIIAGTWGRKCRSCEFEHFPTIAPCTLVLVRRKEEILLIRKAEWPPGYYSLPSGFCDFGESAEECAQREVEEETGIKTDNLRYVGSQCWPFPGQLMIGFTADYAAGEIMVDRDELEDAAWFSKNALPPTFSTKSIAGWMMRSFA